MSTETHPLQLAAIAPPARHPIRILGPRLLLEPCSWHQPQGLIALPQTVTDREKKLWVVVGLPEHPDSPKTADLLLHLTIGSHILLNYDQNVTVLDNQQVVARLQDVLAVIADDA